MSAPPPANHALPPQAYRAPFWLPGGHAQTLYAVLCAPRPRVRYRRERWETPDGDFIDVDWVADASTEEKPAVAPHASPAHRAVSASRLAPGASRPLIVLFHGLEGSSCSHYALSLMHEVHARGWRGAVVHFRTCSGELNRLPRAYHSGDSAEIDWVLRRLAGGGMPVCAVGVSLGGNALLKWLGEAGAAGSKLVHRAAAVSAPMDLMAAGNALDCGFNRVYSRNFLRTLRRKAIAKLALHPHLYESAAIGSTRTLREFDDVVTAPLHGFRSTDDYWTRASSKPWLRHIAVPTLLINARNDPFLPASALPAPRDLSPAVTIDFPAEGGHAGFVWGAFPGSLRWLPQRVLRFLWP